MHVALRATAVVMVVAGLTAMVIGCAGPTGSPGVLKADCHTYKPDGTLGVCEQEEKQQPPTSDEVYASLASLIDQLTEFKDAVTTQDFILHADAIDDVLRQSIEGLQGMNSQQFSDGLDNIAQSLYDALGLIENDELPDYVYEAIRVLEPRHVDQLVTIIDLARAIAERVTEQIGDYRAEQTLSLLGEVGKELDRLGSKRKLLRLLRIVSRRAPEVLVEALNRLDVGDTLAPAVNAIGSVLDEVAYYVEDYVL